MINIYKYTDYKNFLKDYYNEQKINVPVFSYQYMADHCGFNSKTYIFKVIKGQKALTAKSALKIASFMKLSKKETEYFENIVMFTNSKSVEEKDYYFNKIQSLNKKSSSVKLRQDQYDYFSKWYNIALREVVTLIDWNNDYTKLANSLTPSISVKEAKKAVELLKDLNLIQVDKDGRYYHTNQAITTGKDIVSLAVNNFQKKNLELAKESIDRFKRELRDISTLTISISEEGIEQVRKEIAECRKRIVELVNKEEVVDRVYQINFQSFPIHLPKKRSINE